MEESLTTLRKELSEVLKIPEILLSEEWDDFYEIYLKTLKAKK